MGNENGLSIFIAATLVVPLGGCFAISDLDRFEEGGDLDLEVELVGFDSQDDERVEARLVRVVTGGSSVIEGRAVFDGIDPDRGADFFLPGAIGDGQYQLHVYLDQNWDDEVSDGEPYFRQSVPSSGQVVFSSNVPQPPDDGELEPAGQDFDMDITGMGVHTGGVQLFECLVMEAETGRGVGYYRLPDIDEVDFAFTIPGIVVPGTEYQVDFYADANQSGAYEAEFDHSWREFGTADADGLFVEFGHHTPFVPLDF